MQTWDVKPPRGHLIKYRAGKKETNGVKTLKKKKKNNLSAKIKKNTEQGKVGRDEMVI